MTENEEPLISLRPQTDFEKLVWANSLNKELADGNKKLAFQLGSANSEISELNDKLAKQKVEILNEVQNTGKKTMMLRIVNMQEELDKLKKKCKNIPAMEKTIENLICKCAKLQVEYGQKESKEKETEGAGTTKEAS